MAAIDKRVGLNGEVTFRARVRVRGQSRTATFKRKTDAKEWAAKTETELKRGRHIPTPEAARRTVGDMVDRYLSDVLPTKTHNRDQANPARQLKWWKAELGNVRLVDLTPALIIERRDKLRLGKNRYGKPISSATVNRYLAALSHALRVAVKEWQWIEVSPMQQVSKLGESPGRVRYLDDDERGRLLDACKQSKCPLLYPIVVLALSTGARRGEIVSIRWPQVDLQSGTIVLQDTKNGERRLLPLVGHALELIQGLAKVRKIDNDHVFPGRKRDQSIDFETSWRAALKRARLDDFRFHDLRHSAASYLAMNGATPSEIAAVLGHRTLQMVKRYAHLSDTHISSVVARMNQKVFSR